MSRLSGQLLRPLIAKDVVGFVKRYVVSYEDAMKLTSEKHLKARLNINRPLLNLDANDGDDDDVVEVAEENDIREAIQ